jgi:hypothetical protein
VNGIVSSYLEGDSLDLSVALNALLSNRKIDSNHALSVLGQSLEVQLEFVLVDVKHLSNGALVGNKDGLCIEANKHATGDCSRGDVIVLLKGGTGDGILGLEEAHL